MAWSNAVQNLPSARPLLLSDCTPVDDGAIFIRKNQTEARVLTYFSVFFNRNFNRILKTEAL
jgi:hypothetical protein